MLVYVDKRITLAAFKQKLEAFIGVPSSQFKVFRVYANNQEFESVRLNETLSSFSDDNKVSLLLRSNNLKPSLLDLLNHKSHKGSRKGRGIFNARFISVFFSFNI